MPRKDKSEHMEWIFRMQTFGKEMRHKRGYLCHGINIPANARRISPKRTLVQTPRPSLCCAALADANSNPLLVEGTKREKKEKEKGNG